MAPPVRPSPPPRAARLAGLLLPALLALLAPARAPAAPLVREGAVSLDGEWRYVVGELAAPPAPPLDPRLPRMRVPSNWFREGQDVSGVVWFLREVELPGGGAGGAGGGRGGAQAWALELDGVDYAADVYWDGRRVGGHRGYFAPFTVPLPPEATRGGGRHLLAVRVDSPLEGPEAFSQRKTLVKGVLSHHDTRPGGAWSPRGQEQNTGGIWGSVRLVPVRTALLASARALTLSADEAGARLRLEVALRPRGDARPGARVTYAVRGPTGALLAAGAFPGGVQAAGGDGGAGGEGGGLQRLRAEVVLRRPARWWPRELGPSPLHRLEVAVEGPGGARDAASLPFGVRTVEEDRDGRLRVNGVPVFLRGVNHIPTLYLAGSTAAGHARDLALMREAHVNAVRVHAHVASPAFYAEADASGMLVYQDLPLQWGYEDSPAFHAHALEQARELVEAVGHHPSVVHWTAHNEAPWSSEWMRHKYPRWDPDQNRALDAALLSALREADPTRPVRGNSHPSEHLWLGWYAGAVGDFRQPTAVVLPTEFGAQAVPAVETLRTFLREEQLWPLEGETLAVWEYHGFQKKELTELAKVPLGRSVEELVAHSQGYQAHLLQVAAESLRLQKWQPVAGLFQFMFSEHWPSISWGVVDHLRRPKRGYAALARAYQPLLPAAARHPGADRLAVYVVNDGRQSLPGLVLRAEGGRGARAWRAALPVDVPADAVARPPFTLPLPPRGEPLELWLEDGRGRRLAANAYAPGFFESPAPQGP
jgi:beta-mannosidase